MTGPRDVKPPPMRVVIAGLGIMRERHGRLAARGKLKARPWWRGLTRRWR